MELAEQLGIGPGLQPDSCTTPGIGGILQPLKNLWDFKPWSCDQVGVGVFFFFSFTLKLESMSMTLGKSTNNGAFGEQIGHLLYAGKASSIETETTTQPQTL